MAVKLLIPRKDYLVTGIHIGAKSKTKDMREFIYKVRPDGLTVFNLKKIDDRIRVASKFLARSEKILVASRKKIAKEIVERFGEVINARVSTGRFLPGTLTNPNCEYFFEADVVLITDPLTDKRALEEAVKARIPVVAICNSSNETKNVDLIIPGNNRGKKSLALLFYLLAREILRERGKIKSPNEFKFEDFLPNQKIQQETQASNK
ncbi:MAG: 30S ribosomal protein S2 [Candidatus Aenigmatarchaeota archaeon]|jgi:small subunit ribosomal protein S2